MDHLSHGYVSHNQRVNGSSGSRYFFPRGDHNPDSKMRMDTFQVRVPCTFWIKGDDILLCDLTDGNYYPKTLL